MKKCFNGTNEAFYTKVEENLDKEQKMFIVTANPETFMRAHQDKEIEKMLMDDQTTIIPDGVGVIKGAQYAGIKMQENVTGVDLAKKLLEYANEKKQFIILMYID